MNLGDDADKTGAVCDEFEGAYFSLEGVGDHLRQGLAQSQWIESIASLLSGCDLREDGNSPEFFQPLIALAQFHKGS